MIQSTIDLLREHRSEDLSVSQIVKVGGLSRQVFYEHFADRDALLLAAGEQMVNPALQWAGEVSRGGIGPDRAVERLFELIEPYRSALSNLCDGPVHWRLHSYGMSEVEPFLRAELTEVLSKDGQEVSESHLKNTSRFISCGVIAQFTDAIREGRSAEDARRVMREIRETISVVTYKTP
ncbi:TetR/AcrR family transcriptional regulator [Corynebacterium liangguodongii]|uniref:TetR/AcrR family transcriptional regulator n=1 Tax=Corynebacterium liangguodongii TaxID=2079535 RepID=UPI001304B202|nr:TetR/AcrR family transcriptional regulator [Corynebacterium liangguodongii]